jgi:serine/threonine protein phosphatase PrpC
MDLTQTLEIATCTDPGMVRSHNEDSIAADAANGLVVLADGMGGYNAGEVASGMATTVIVTEMRQILASARPYELDQKNNQEIAARMVREQVLKANSSIYQAAQSQPQYAGMGTTLVVCLFYDNRVLAAHLGDSRLYLLSSRRRRPRTRIWSPRRSASIPWSSRKSTSTRPSPATSICCAPMACATWWRTRTSA